MTDWLSRAPSVNMIYFVPLEVAAACFFALFWNRQYEVHHQQRFLRPEFLKPLIRSPTEFQFLGFIWYFVPVLLLSLQRLWFPRSLWLLEIDVLSDWSFSLDLCTGPAAQGSPLLAALPVQTRPLHTPLELKNFLPFRLNGSNPLSLFPNFNTVSQKCDFKTCMK